MALRKIAKTLLKLIKAEPITKTDEIETDRVKKILVSALDDKKTYKENKPFIMRLVQYYAEHKRFTEVQRVALERVLSHG